MKDQLTVQEAIAEGFKYAGLQGENFQRVTAIHSIDADSIATGRYYLASKEKTTPSTNAESLLDLISNDIEGQWYDETHDDDSGIYEALKGIDLTDITEQINDRLKKVWNVKITGIQLIP